MPLPEKFYDADGNEVTLEMLCHKAPYWAANRIRQLTEACDLGLDAMDYMGDILNNHDLSTPEDVEKTSPAFEKMRWAIGATPTPKKFGSGA